LEVVRWTGINARTSCSNRRTHKFIFGGCATQAGSAISSTASCAV
jgi:hypothetical protein